METSVPDEEVFWDIKIQVLHELRDILVKNIYPDKFFAYLRTRRVLDGDDCDEICAEKTRRKQAEKFLDVLESKGPDAFDEFCEILRKNKTQLFLLRKIFDRFEEKKLEVFGPLPTFPAQTSSMMDDMNSRPPKPVAIVTPYPGIPDTLSISQDGSYLPGPGEPGGPTPPEDDNHSPMSSLPMVSVTSQNPSLGGVVNPAPPENACPAPPPYSSTPSQPPSADPPPYSE